MTKKNERPWTVAVALGLLATAGCGDLLDVESPGRISDEDLGSPDAIPAVMTGAQFNLSDAVDANLEMLALASGELFHGGSYDWADVPRGVINDDDPGVDDSWSETQQARWVAEDAIAKIDSLLGPEGFSSSPDAARALIYAGYANRILGGSWCASAINGGPEVPNTDHFERAMQQFTDAVPIAEAAARPDLVNAALAGRAQVRVLTGDWEGASTDAAAVPVEFVFVAPIDIELGNSLASETHSRFEYTVWGTYMEDHPDDPRAPWDIARNNDGTVANGANGTTPHYRQDKFPTNDADVALAKGTEMLLVRAEAALRAGDVSGAYGYMNQARAFYALAALPASGGAEAAWAALRFERGATLWLEGRRLEDQRRWFADTGPAHDDFLASRARCVPISEEEKLANPNLKG
jgi:hypothetical protein